jgi:phosphate-selective porin OprO/OprP
MTEKMLSMGFPGKEPDSLLSRRIIIRAYMLTLFFLLLAGAHGWADTTKQGGIPSESAAKLHPPDRQEEAMDLDSESGEKEENIIATSVEKEEVWFRIGDNLLGAFNSLRPGVKVADEFSLDRSYDHGFVIADPQERWILRLGGRLIARYTDFISESPLDDDFDIQTARLYTNLKFWDYFDLRVQGEFSTSALFSEIEGEDTDNDTIDADFKDLYLNMDYFEWGQLRVGQFKVPFSLERLQSSKYLDFVDRAVGPRNMGRPTRDIGVMVHGSFNDELAQYQVAVTSGSGPNTSDENSEKDVSGRFTFQPFRDSGNELLSGLHPGISGTWGKMDKDFSDTAYSTETGLRFVAFANGTASDGDRSRLGTELLWFKGPASIKAEWMKMWLEDIRKGASEEDADFSSWYISGTYLLTGEKKTPWKIVPDRPLNIAERTWGAWELAARYSRFHVDSDLFRTGMVTGADKASILELGINWYLNEFFRFTVNYEHAEFDDALLVDGKTIDEEDAILAQLQFEF